MEIYDKVDSYLKHDLKIPLKQVSKEEFEDFINNYPYLLGIYKSGFGADIYYDKRRGKFSPVNDRVKVASYYWEYQSTYYMPDLTKMEG